MLSRIVSGQYAFALAVRKDFFAKQLRVDIQPLILVSPFMLPLIFCCSNVKLV